MTPILRMMGRPWFFFARTLFVAVIMWTLSGTTLTTTSTTTTITAFTTAFTTVPVKQQHRLAPPQVYNIMNNINRRRHHVEYDASSLLLRLDATAVPLSSSSPTPTQQRNESISVDAAATATESSISTNNNVESSQQQELSSSSHQQQQPQPQQQHFPPTQKTAVLCNANARAVNARVCEAAREIFDTAYITHDMDQAQHAVDDLVAHLDDYKCIVAVGGDGTLATAVQDMCRAMMASTLPSHAHITTVSQALAALPPLGYIPLGTGNAVGSVMGRPTALNSENKKKRQKNRSWKRFVPLLGRRQNHRLERIRTWMQTLHNLSSYDNNNNNNDINSDLGQVDATYDLVELSMIEIETDPVNDTENDNNNKTGLCFFAGVGFDSLMLDDFQVIKTWSRRTRILPQFLSSVAGYGVALVVRTLPWVVRQGGKKKPKTNKSHGSSGGGSSGSGGGGGHEIIHVTVRTTDADATWMDHRRGDLGRRAVVAATQNAKDGSETANHVAVPPSYLLYNGTAGICAAATVPYYGGGLRLFPFTAGAPGTAHLRIGRIHPLRGALHIPSIFAGTYRDTRPRSFGCLDFVAKDYWIDVRAAGATTTTALSSSSSSSNTNGNEKPHDDDNATDEHTMKASDGFPLQHSGDSVGNVQRFRLKVTSAPVRLISPLPPRPTQG